MTFDEVRTKTLRAAQNLQSRGYEQNQVIGFLVGNHSNVAPIAFASIAIGCAICPFDTSFGKAKLLEMLKIIKPVLMFCEAKCYAILEECLVEVENKAKIFVFEGGQDHTDHVDDLFEKTHNENQFS